jgi:hypothetical protein
VHIGGLHVEIMFTDKALEKPESAPTSVGTSKDNVVAESSEVNTDETIPSVFPNKTRNPPARQLKKSIFKWVSYEVKFAEKKRRRAGVKRSAVNQDIIPFPTTLGNP